MSDRDFLIKPDEDEWPYSWIVMSYLSHDNYKKPELVEAWSTEEEAVHYGKIRHDQGYVVSVYKQVAFTVGGASAKPEIPW